MTAVKNTKYWEQGEKMEGRRTDLALEARELWQESSRDTSALPGVRAREELREEIPVHVRCV